MENAKQCRSIEILELTEVGSGFIGCFVHGRPIGLIKYITSIPDLSFSVTMFLTQYKFMLL